jgi:hypothetical protein
MPGIPFLATAVHSPEANREILPFTARLFF